LYAITFTHTSFFAISNPFTLSHCPYAFFIFPITCSTTYLSLYFSLPFSYIHFTIFLNGFLTLLCNPSLTGTITSFAFSNINLNTSTSIPYSASPSMYLPFTFIPFIISFNNFLSSVYAFPISTPIITSLFPFILPTIISTLTCEDTSLTFFPLIQFNLCLSSYPNPVPSTTMNSISSPSSIPMIFNTSSNNSSKYDISILLNL